MPSRLLLLLVLLCTATAGATSAQEGGDAGTAAEAWWPVSVETRHPPFNPQGTLTRSDYVPVERAMEFHWLCASLPDLEVGYMLAVAHGMREEARRQGVSLQIENAGGFDRARQRAQLASCLEDDADAILVVDVTGEGFADVIAQARARGTTVIDVATGTGSDNVTARILADSVAVGHTVADYLAARHPLGTDVASAIWLPGPPDADFAVQYDRGFRAGIGRGAIDIAASEFSSLQPEALRRQIRRLVTETATFDIFAGTSPAVLVAVEELAGAGTANDVAVVSTGISNGIIAGIEAGRVAAAINDKPVIQGRIAVDLAVRALEKRPFLAEIRPALDIVDATNVETFDRTTALAPLD